MSKVPPPDYNQASYPPNQYPAGYSQQAYPPNQYAGAQVQAPPPQGNMGRGGTTVIVQQGGGLGPCHTCGGATYETFSTCGIIWAICCFPLGLICLLTDKDRKCAVCGRLQN